MYADSAVASYCLLIWLKLGGTTTFSSTANGKEASFWNSVKEFFFKKVRRISYVYVEVAVAISNRR